MSAEHNMLILVTKLEAILARVDCLEENIAQHAEALTDALERLDIKITSAINHVSVNMKRR